MKHTHAAVPTLIGCGPTFDSASIVLRRQMMASNAYVHVCVWLCNCFATTNIIYYLGFSPFAAMVMAYGCMNLGSFISSFSNGKYYSESLDLCQLFIIVLWLYASLQFKLLIYDFVVRVTISDIQESAFMKLNSSGASWVLSPPPTRRTFGMVRCAFFPGSFFLLSMVVVRKWKGGRAEATERRQHTDRNFGDHQPLGN